jgi:hemolysin D
MSKLLPAAIDFQSDARKIDERRPPWLARATLYALVAVIFTAVTFAAITKIDQIVVAQGKLVTTAATMVVQPLETSVVRSLSARVGDIVRKGETLATLDPTFSEADADQLRGKIKSLAAQIERLEAEINDTPYEPRARDDEARLQAMIWTRSIEQNKAKLASFDQQVRHVEAEMATKSADKAALEVRLGVARDLEGMRAYLMQKELGSKVNYLDAESQRLQIEREMQLATNTMTELQQELEGHEADKAAYLAEFRQKTAEELVQTRRDHDAAVKQLDKAARRNAVTVLTAPADAIVL